MLMTLAFVLLSQFDGELLQSYSHICDESRCIIKQDDALTKPFEDLSNFYYINESPDVEFERVLPLNTTEDIEYKKLIETLVLDGGNTTGCFDSLFSKNLKKYQKTNKLPVTGKLNTKTVNKLSELVSFNIPLLTVSYNDICELTDHDRKFIFDVQKALSFHGYLDQYKEYELDNQTIEAVVDYKRSNTLNNSKSIDKEFVNHLSIDSDTRVKLLDDALKELKKANIKTDNNIYVNIPEFKMRYYFNGENKLTMDIVVGKAEGIPTNKKQWNTNVQKGMIKNVQVNPIWYVPQGEMTKEIRKEMRNSSTLRNTIEQFIDDKWLIIKSGVYGSRFRQLPGIDNPLGRLAFDFGGGNGEFLHGTPHHEVFKNNTRAYSHGCMRLFNEFRLFHTFQDVGIVDEKINVYDLVDESVKGKYKTRLVNLNTSVAVNVIYLLAWAQSDSGKLRMTILKDVYNLKIKGKK